MHYIGRFAPSPSGPLHAGSLVAALASWLDARAHDGQWRLRIEDVDTPRTVPGAAQHIMMQLRALGLHWDGEVLWQSQRDAAYQTALADLQHAGLVYGCACTRREIADSARRDPSHPDAERPYPGTCRHGLAPTRCARAWRLRVPAGIERFTDRWLGAQAQEVATVVGDFALKRADGLWAYQLAVVVDDAAQSITHIVRGADLLGSTARQRVLGRLLRLPLPQMMHVPLVIDPLSGLKLSKQNHAPPIDLQAPLVALDHAWLTLGFATLNAPSISDFLTRATTQWAMRFGLS